MELELDTGLAAASLVKSLGGKIIFPAKDGSRIYVNSKH